MRVYTLLILLVLGGLSMGYGQQLPTDFPKYVDTGDKERDVLNYDMQKKAWITTHTEEYIAMQPGLSEEGKVSLRAQNLIRKEKTIKREANKEKEEEISEEYREKLLWILEHDADRIYFDRGKRKVYA